MLISKKIQIWGGIKMVVVEIYKTICDSVNTEKLIKSTCFYLKTSQVHAFCSNLSRVHMFCVDNNSKLVPGSMHSGFPEL